MPFEETFKQHVSPLHSEALPKEVTYKYFLNVLAVTDTLSANNTANGNTMKVGCKLNGRAR